MYFIVWQSMCWTIAAPSLCDLSRFESYQCIRWAFASIQILQPFSKRKKKKINSIENLNWSNIQSFTDLYCLRTLTAPSIYWIFSLIFSTLTSPCVPNVYSNSLILICNYSISSYPSLIFYSSSLIIFSKS